MGVPTPDMSTFCKMCVSNERFGTFRGRAPGAPPGSAFGTSQLSTEIKLCGRGREIQGTIILAGSVQMVMRTRFPPKLLNLMRLCNKTLKTNIIFNNSTNNSSEFSVAVSGVGANSQCGCISKYLYIKMIEWGSLGGGGRRRPTGCPNWLLCY